MNNETQQVTVKLISSAEFANEMQKNSNFDIQSVRKSEIGHIPLSLAEVVAIVTIAKTLIEIVKFIIEFYGKKKREEQITIILEDGEQLEIRNTDEAKRVIKKLQG